MIICVNLNVAIDKTLIVETYTPGNIHRPKSVLNLGGGKGANVARVLNTLNHPVCVTGWVGGHAGKFIEAQLNSENVQTAFVHSSIESRTCTSVLDLSTGQITEIYENGSMIDADAVDRFHDVYETLLPDADFITFSGSVPPGAPSNIYQQLIDKANQHNIPTLLDSSGEAFRQGISGKPTYIKPNITELEDLVGEKLRTNAAIIASAKALVAQYGVTVIVSNGKHGALAIGADEVWNATLPAIDAISAVGSGDSLTAGFVAAVHEGQPLGDALKQGVACGSANTLQVGAGRLNEADVHKLMSQVNVELL